MYEKQKLDKNSNKINFEIKTSCVVIVIKRFYYSLTIFLKLSQIHLVLALQLKIQKPCYLEKKGKIYYRKKIYANRKAVQKGPRSIGSKYNMYLHKWFQTIDDETVNAVLEKFNKIGDRNLQNTYLGGFSWHICIATPTSSMGKYPITFIIDISRRAYSFGPPRSDIRHKCDILHNKLKDWLSTKMKEMS